LPASFLHTTIPAYMLLAPPLRLLARSTLRTAPLRRISRAAVHIPAAPRTQQPTRSLRSLAQLDTLSSEQPAPADAHAMASSTAIPPAVPDQAGADAAAARVAAPPSIILTLSCPDRQGIVHAVSGWLASRGLNIRDSAQFGDATTRRFFMRVHAEAMRDSSKGLGLTQERLREEFQRDLAGEMQMDFDVQSDDYKPRTLLMVSKIGREWRCDVRRGELLRAGMVTCGVAER
jgi:predicted amino acid-binding ACT domain protein